MTQYALTLEVRNPDTKLSDIRRGDGDKKAQIPGVFYGKWGVSTSFVSDYSDFLKIFRDAGKSNIIEVTLGKESHDVLVQDVQLHPITSKMLHVDFHVLTRGEKVHTEIPLTLVGESPASREGAVIDQSQNTLDVKCLPRDLVDHFDVDISLLKNAGDIIHVSDLNLDVEKYEIQLDPEAAIVAAHAPRAQEVEEPVVAAVEEEDGWEEGTAEDGWESTE